MLNWLSFERNVMKVCGFYTELKLKGQLMKNSWHWCPREEGNPPKNPVGEILGMFPTFIKSIDFQIKSVTTWLNNDILLRKSFFTIRNSNCVFDKFAKVL